MPTETEFFRLGGGTDLVTPAIVVDSGRARASVNYEPLDAGYQRVDGFERLDGQPKPGEADYWILDFDAGTAAINEGDIVTGETSGATGEALIDAELESGTYGGSDAAGYNVLLNLTGAFQNDENLQVLGVIKSVADGAEKLTAADTDALNDTYSQDAIETTRTDILVVPGSGNMRGAWLFNGDEYAFRDNSGATAVDMYKSTASGWVLQNLGETLAYTSGGTYVIAEGDIIVGVTSGATGTVKRVIIDTGTFAGGNAEGRLILYNVVGTFQAENLDVLKGAVAPTFSFSPPAGRLAFLPAFPALTVTTGSAAHPFSPVPASLKFTGQVPVLDHRALNVATVAGDAVPNTLAAGGRFDFVNSNFGGHSGTERMYGADSKSRAFEWDGAVFVPIVTGMTADTPSHVIVHKKHLFLSFTGGSVQHSGIGDPYAWSVILGAAELAIGQEVTGFSRNVTRTLTIFGRNTVAILYGTSASDWELDVLTDEAGAIEWTAQVIGSPIYVDDRGLRSLETTQAFGDFKLGTLSKAIEPIFKAKKKLGVTAIASVRVRAKDQYRLFWSDGTGMTMYLGRGVPEIMEFSLGKVVHTIASGEDGDGNEIIIFGSTDGFIYELDAGTSFDGSSISAYIRLPFNHVGSPTQHKRWSQVTLELEAAIDTGLKILTDFGFGDPEGTTPGEESFTVTGGAGYWNLDNWNEFEWSSQAEGVALIHIDGEGTNMSVSLLSDKIYEAPHTIAGITLHYSNLRLQR